MFSPPLFRAILIPQFSAVSGGHNQGAERLTIYGYARVSTDKQDTDAQRAALEAAGCAPIIEEQASGRRARPALQRLLDSLAAGDVLTVWKVNRLARSVADFYRVTEAITAKGAELRSLSESFDTSTPIGRAMLGMLAVFAQFEVEQTSENIKGGLRAARSRGKRLGRPRAVSDELAAEIRQRLDNGEPVKDLARIHRIDAATVRRIRSRC